MKSKDKATIHLQKTGWHSEQLAEIFGISPRIARMYLSGDRKIPERFHKLIPIDIFQGDTHTKGRTKREERVKELKKYSIPVPFKN
ncbi:MAG: hypothetical protein FWC19_04430 [Treponema sp.]|nr:hypothetical protein [Treponema sp.]MCL2272037.1 hypothetical protein [Treponema sp.]